MTHPPCPVSPAATVSPFDLGRHRPRSPPFDFGRHRQRHLPLGMEEGDKSFHRHGCCGSILKSIFRHLILVHPLKKKKKLEQQQQTKELLLLKEIEHILKKEKHNSSAPPKIHFEDSKGEEESHPEDGGSHEGGGKATIEHNTIKKKEEEDIEEDEAKRRSYLQEEENKDAIVETTALDVKIIDDRDAGGTVTIELDNEEEDVENGAKEKKDKDTNEGEEKHDVQIGETANKSNKDPVEDDSRIRNSPAVTMEEEAKEKHRDSNTYKLCLPDDVIAEIFLHVPLSSLRRLRYMSKMWGRRISHPSFTLSHLSFHPLITPFLSDFRHRADLPIILWDDDQPTSSTGQLTYYCNIIVSSGSGSGPVLISRCHVDHLINLDELGIWDPATRRLSSIPLHPGPYPLPEFPKPRGIALISNPSNPSSFKVILVAQPEGKAVHTYSSDLATWTITIASGDVKNGLRRPLANNDDDYHDESLAHDVYRYTSLLAVVIKGGFLFWSIRAWRSLQVLAYDVGRSHFWAIQLPATPKLYWCLDQWEERLRYTLVLPSREMAIWELDPHWAWRLKYKFSLVSVAGVSPPHRLVMPMAMYRHVVFLQQREKETEQDLPKTSLLTYDLVSRELKEMSRAEYHSKYRRIFPCRYFDWWPIIDEQLPMHQEDWTQDSNFEGFDALFNAIMENLRCA